MSVDQDPEIAKVHPKVPHLASSRDVTPVPIEGETEHLPTYEHERALTQKFDFRMLPMLAIMYLFNALDKGNLGNAKTDGMDKDLGFKGNQYNTMLSVSNIAFAPRPIFNKY